MNIAYIAGILAGILVGIIFIFFFSKWTKKDGRMNCKWDERQVLIRGRGYQIAFFTVIILLAVYSLTGSGIEGFLMDHETACLFIVFTGAAVHMVYCIWRGAYFSLNENRKRVLVMFAVLGIINLGIGFRELISGDAVTDGILNIRSANLFCGSLFALVFITLLVKIIVSGNDWEER